MRRTGGDGYRSQQCLIPDGHKGLHLDEHGNRWGEPARVREALAAAENAGEAEAVLWGMNRDDLRAVAAASARGAFDAALDELLDLGDDEDQDDDEEPYCSACGASVGIFRGRGDAWLHYLGQGTADSPVELFDAGHQPVIAWRPAGAR